LDDRLKVAERDLAKAEKETSGLHTQLFKAQQQLASDQASKSAGRRKSAEPDTPPSADMTGGSGGAGGWLNSEAKAVSDETIKRLQKRVTELEGLVGATHHVGHEMASELKERREAG
jgi:hypothetical protein